MLMQLVMEGFVKREELQEREREGLLHLLQLYVWAPVNEAARVAMGMFLQNEVDRSVHLET